MVAQAESLHTIGRGGLPFGLRGDDAEQPQPMLAAGIAVGVHYPPNHLQLAFAQWRRSLPVTEQLGREILSLPFHQHMTEDDVHHVATALKRATRNER
ncbi:DegT/DnrJ/EryC1/StrS family aminotransferase [Kitasatospora sp. NPDC059463]|uniref:DegT/DnrJ/EryC1/StrS family aminotransferase n=1 Tax=unclassified Kitasatospora TaxID=2633591 RepID=UPI0036ACA7D8